LAHQQIGIAPESSPQVEMNFLCRDRITPASCVGTGSIREASRVTDYGKREVLQRRAAVAKYATYSFQQLGSPAGDNL